MEVELDKIKCLCVIEEVVATQSWIEVRQNLLSPLGEIEKCAASSRATMGAILEVVQCQ